MRDKRPPPQHIEVVTLDDASWGNDSSWDHVSADSPFTTPPSLRQPPRRRRRLIAAGLVALALVAVATGVALSNDDDDVRPPAAFPGHFIIGAADLRPYSADLVTPLPTNARFTLFANGNPTNPWISLQTYRRRSDPVEAMDSFRREVDGRNLITPRNERSMTTIVIDLGDGWAADVRAFNVEDRQLVRFVNSLTRVDGDVLFDESILVAYSLMATRTASWAEELLYGTVTTEMRAMTSNGSMITLREAVGDVDTRAATLPYFTTGLMDGSDGYTAGTLIANGDAIVTWATDGRLLSLQGPVPTNELLAISRTVRVADETEWRELVYGLHPDYRLGEFAEAGSGTDIDGWHWSSGVQLAERGGRPEYLWWWTLPGTSTSASTPTGIDLAAGSGNETIIVGNSTYVFVWVPATSEATTALVRAANGGAVRLQLRTLFAEVPVLLAATRIDVPGPVEVSTD